ncbi:MAG: VWA domain-containing protein [Flavobacteriales bacterium]|nr:VWA domain-containing protein [Flavobacteriales bacterium]
MKDEKWLDFHWFSYSFAEKEYLWLLLIIPVLIAWKWYQHKKSSVVLNFSSTQSFSDTSTFWNWIPPILYGIKMAGLALLIIAFARPQMNDDEVIRKQTSEGIDIVMAIDISGSMLAEDFKPNRLEVAKEVAIDFIKKRPNDRIGLVVYEGQAFTQCPLTTDHSVLIRLFNDVETGMIQDGTAIGMGLATAVNRLAESDGKSKVVILLTDGVNNQGNIDPLTAAEIAKEYNVRVYTIGVGKNGMAPFPMVDMFGRKTTTMMEVKIDEEVMKSIAEMTDGKYFRAENKKKLEDIYKEIDQMEKTKIRVTEFKMDPPEMFHSFVFVGLLLIAAEYLIRRLILSAPNE